MRGDLAMGYLQALAREGIDAAIVGDVTEPSWAVSSSTAPVPSER